MGKVPTKIHIVLFGEMKKRVFLVKNHYSRYTNYNDDQINHDK